MNKKHLCLFDMDGTLTPIREKISQPMIKSLAKLGKVSRIGIVTGSGMDYVHEQCEELLNSDIDLTIYPCNGTQTFVKEKGEWVLKNTVKMKEEVGESSFRELVFCLLILQASLSQEEFGDIIPVSGTYIQYRGSMINWCMIGRNATKEERIHFASLDREYKIREILKQKLENMSAKFNDKLSFAIGGATSIDIYPKGWDKTFCLRNYDSIENIYFLGDACDEGRNDFEIFEKLKPRSFHVKNPNETIKIISDLIEKMN